MSYCCVAQDNAYPCSNRAKYRRPSRRCRNNDIHEMPEKDMLRPKHSETNVQFPPPDPPNGEIGGWELQYCKWMGWTWVKKDTISYQNPKPSLKQATQKEAEQELPKTNQPPRQQPPKKKKGGLFSCFKKKETPPPPPTAVKSTVNSSTQGTPTPKRSDHDSVKGVRGSRSDELDDECSCCGMEIDLYCCPCNQVCCPCMLQKQICCCYSDDDNEPEKRRECKECKTTETQTCREMKEQSTKMSVMCVPKQKATGRRRRCRCRRSICCPCMRNTCCPCVQNVCCRCRGGNFQVDEKSSKNKQTPNNNNALINYFLTKDLHKPPSKPDFLNLKSSDFVTLHKSLDLLLKNNINIMSLFDDNKGLQKDVKPAKRFDSNHTITCLSSENIVKKADREHCKLLTAVCDAILSSHKFDNDKFSTYPARGSKSSKSTQKIDSQNSFNIFSSKGFLEKILSDLNFPNLTKSNDDFNVQREIGVQVGSHIPKRIEFCQSKKSLTKLARNRSRIIAAPRFPKKIEALKKNIELLRCGRQSIKKYRGKVENRKPKIDDSKLSLTDIFKTLDGESAAENKLKDGVDWQSGAPQSSSFKTEPSSKLETLEHLLNSVDFINSSSNVEVNQQSRQDVHLLDATSPPFTDLDLLLTIEDKQKESSAAQNGSASR